MPSMKDTFSKLRPRRSVLKRTTKRPDLPAAVLYVEWLGGEMSRKVVDAEGKEHVLTDATMQSHYKLVSGPSAKELIEAHWAKLAAEPQAPARKE